MPFGLRPCHRVWVAIGISFCLGVMVVIVFGKSQDHESPDHLLYQMASMQETYQKEMQEMHKQHYKHQKQMQDMQKQHQKEMKDMHERQLVIQKQTDLINTFDQIVNEMQRLLDQYIAGIREYSYLKDIHDSWFGSLTRGEQARMDQLEDFLGTNEVIDVHVAIAMVGQHFERVERFFSSQLEELEDALDKMDIDEMKQLQKNTNKKHLSARLQEEIWQIKMEMRSTSRTLKKPGGSVYFPATLNPSI